MLHTRRVIRDQYQLTHAWRSNGRKLIFSTHIRVYQQPIVLGLVIEKSVAMRQYLLGPELLQWFVAHAQRFRGPLRRKLVSISDYSHGRYHPVRTQQPWCMKNQGPKLFTPVCDVTTEKLQSAHRVDGLLKVQGDSERLLPSFDTLWALVLLGIGASC